MVFISRVYKSRIVKLKENRIKLNGCTLLLILLLIVILPLVYNFTVELSLLIARFVPSDLHESEIVQFSILLVPIILISYILEVIILRYPARIFRLLLIAVHIYVEIFIKDTVTIRFSDYLYFYLTIETLLFMIQDRNKQLEGDKTNDETVHEG